MKSLSLRLSLAAALALTTGCNRTTNAANTAAPVIEDALASCQTVLDDAAALAPDARTAAVVEACFDWVPEGDCREDLLEAPLTTDACFEAHCDAITTEFARVLCDDPANARAQMPLQSAALMAVGAAASHFGSDERDTNAAAAALEETLLSIVHAAPEDRALLIANYIDTSITEDRYLELVGAMSALLAAQ